MEIDKSKDLCSLTLREAGFNRDLARDLSLRHGCRTLGDVERLTRRDFARLRSYGQATWCRVNRELSRFGLREIPDDPEIAAMVEASNHPTLAERAHELSVAFAGLERAFRAHRTRPHSADAV